MPFNHEQLRVLENLAVAYDTWVQSERESRGFVPRMAWKSVSGREYLYKITDRRGNGRSLGPRSPGTEGLHAAYTAKRDELKSRLADLRQRLDEIAPLYRALRLPMLEGPAGALLREADVRSVLGSALTVIGTNSMIAYQIEAQERLPAGLDSTHDFDLVWAADNSTTVMIRSEIPTPLHDLFKAVDPTYTVNLERPFQYRNSRAYEVEVLIPPSRMAGYPAAEPLRPLALESQEWLLKGRPLTQVVMDRDGKPARCVAPDPRWMAVHKLWLSQQPDRNPRKTAKDKAQGAALLQLTSKYMPHYPIDREFISGLPPHLGECLSCAPIG